MGRYRGNKLRTKIRLTGDLLGKLLGLSEDYEVINVSYDPHREVVSVIITSDIPIVPGGEIRLFQMAEGTEIPEDSQSGAFLTTLDLKDKEPANGPQ